MITVTISTWNIIDDKRWDEKKNYTNYFHWKKGDKLLLWTAVHASTMRAFMCAVARYEEFKSPNQNFSVKRIHFLPGVLQSGNHVHALTLHYGSVDDDLNTEKPVSWSSAISMWDIWLKFIKYHSDSVYSVMRSRLFCLWLLNECTCSRAVVLIEKHYCNLELLELLLGISLFYQFSLCGQRECIYKSLIIIYILNSL